MTVLAPNAALRSQIVPSGADQAPNTTDGIVKLSKFDQKLGNTRIHNSLIVRHSSSWPEAENQPNLT